MKVNSYLDTMRKDKKTLQRFLKVLADKNKYKIILHLQKGEECVCVIAEKLGLEQSLVSHNLRLLRKAGLVQDRKVGTWVHCSLNKQAFEKLENLYQQILGSKNISDKLCSEHEVCRRLTKKNL